MKKINRQLDMMDGGSYGSKVIGKFFEFDRIINTSKLTLIEIIQHLGTENVENELRKLKLKKIISNK